MNWADVDYFRPDEFACRCCGEVKMHGDFVLRLDDLRKSLGKPIMVTSGYRCPEHNAKVSSTGAQGPHTTGRAADIAIHGRDLYAVLRLAQQRNFTGIGFKQHGPHGRRFVHLDTLLDAPGSPRPWVWSYP